MGQPLAVVAARICRQKGQDIAVEAWPTVREMVPTATLALLGDGPLRASLEQRTEALPESGIRFVGHTDRETTLRWMYAADVVVCPSRWEGMSLVPLEAMALGRPVVATDVDGMCEVIPVQAGRLIPPRRPDAFASAVAGLLADPGVAMAMGDEALEAALQRAKRTVTPPARRLTELYAELLQAPPAP
jgi:glycosyltransferase involved in cell wall biosynthesis